VRVVLNAAFYVEIHCEATDVFDQDGLRLQRLDDFQVRCKQLVSRIVVLAPSGARKTLARRPADQKIDFPFHRFEFVHVIAKKFGDGDRLLGKPSRPAKPKLRALCEQICLQRGESKFVVFNRKSSFETRLHETQRKTATAREGIGKRNFPLIDTQHVAGFRLLQNGVCTARCGCTRLK